MKFGNFGGGRNFCDTEIKNPTILKAGFRRAKILVVMCNYVRSNTNE
jgi:hypothetical protein